jgi:hypothetical protein
MVRATLLLDADPTNSVDASDSLTIYPQVVRAAIELQDVVRSAGILSPPKIEIDSLRIRPNDSGVRAIEMVGARLRQWKAVGPTTLQRAIVLRSATEGVASAPSVLFYSTEAGAVAAPAAPPHLREQGGVRDSVMPQNGVGDDASAVGCLAVAAATSRAAARVRSLAGLLATRRGS